MFLYKLGKPLLLFILLIFILLLIFWGYQFWQSQNHVYSQEIEMVDHIYSQEQKIEGVESCLELHDIDFDFLQRELALNLLGKSFAEIKELLGDPQDEGYSNLHGPHNYMLFNFKNGPILFSSPGDMEKKLAVSILLGGEQEILGARVGMTFLEIKNILGVPNFGPEPGQDNLWYIYYFYGEMTNEVPEVFISFSADAVDSPTHEAFLKWERMGNWDGKVTLLRNYKYD